MSTRPLVPALVVLAVLAGLFLALDPLRPATPAPPPALPAPVVPTPTPAPPPPRPCPPNRPCPRVIGLRSEAKPGTRLYQALLPVPAPQADGDPQVDLLAMPAALRPHNVGGRDGAGLCVFTSIQYAAEWSNSPTLRDFQAKMRQELGGGWPTKVDQMVAKYGPGTRYLQYQGRDPAVIEAALKTGRVPCITWQANHMLCCVALTPSQGAIVDNNYPDRVQWFSRDVFLQKWTQGGGGWVVVLLTPPPPAPPTGPRQALRLAGLPASRPPCGQFFPGPYWPAPAPWRPAPVLPRPNPPRGVQNWVRPRLPTYTYCGRRVTGPEALLTLQDGLPDDSAHLSLTIIGPEAERKGVLADLSADPGLAALAPRFRVQSYGPSDWAVAGMGFITTGRPTIYLQTAGGRPVWRADSYPGPVVLAAALRRADPSYNPQADPSPTPTPALPGLADVPPEHLRAGAILGLTALGSFSLLALRKRKTP